MNTNIITFTIAVVGWGVVILQTIVGYLERRNTHNDEILLKAVNYFTSDAHNRSIGIALIEGLMKSNKKYHLVIAPLLANQLVYLLLQLRSNTNSITEERNAIRIFFLFKNIILNRQSLYHHSICEILNAIQIRIRTKEKSSIDIPNSTLKIWAKDLGYIIGSNDE